MPRQIRLTKDYIFSRVSVDEDGCWIWQGNFQSHGYSHMKWKASEELCGSHIGHRVVYSLFIGRIPAGMTIDHLCNVCACVNPEHLEAVTQDENNRRRDDRRYATGKFPCGHYRRETGYLKREGYMRDGSIRRVRRCQPCTLAYYRKKNNERKLRG